MGGETKPARTGKHKIIVISAGADGWVVAGGGVQELEQRCTGRPPAPGRSSSPIRCIGKWFRTVAHLPIRAIRSPLWSAVFNPDASTSSSSTMSAPAPSSPGSVSSPEPGEVSSPSPARPEPWENLPRELPFNEPFAVHGTIINPVHTPSVEQCKQVIEFGRDTTLFHSGGMAANGFLDEVLAEKRWYLKGYKPLCQKHTSRDFSRLYRKNKQAWCNMSTALAHGSSGTAYVLLPPGERLEGIPLTGHFYRDEWPFFGPKLECVIRICAVDPGIREVIWSRPPPPWSPSPSPSPSSSYSPLPSPVFTRSPSPSPSPSPTPPPPPPTTSHRYNLRARVREQIQAFTYKETSNRKKRQRVATK